MVLTTNQLQLFTPIYDEFMLSEFGEEKMLMPKIFDQKDDKTYEYKTDSISGLGEWGDADEGADGNYVDPVLGYAATLTPAKRRQRLQVSFESVDRDEYAILSKEGEARMMGRGGNFRVEKKSASILYDGFSTACPDGQYLFDSDHPKNSEETGITYDNLLTGPLSHDNLEVAEKQLAANMIAPDGIPIPLYDKPILLVPSALKGQALRLCSDRSGDNIPGQQDYGINIFANKYEVVVWRMLDKAFGGSDTAWYIVFPWMKMFKFIWQVRPHFLSWVDNPTESYIFSGRMIFDCGVTDWRGAAASTGLGN